MVKYRIASKKLTDNVQADQDAIQARLEKAAEDGYELVAAVPHPDGYLMLFFKKSN